MTVKTELEINQEVYVIKNSESWSNECVLLLTYVLVINNRLIAL